VWFALLFIGCLFAGTVAAVPGPGLPEIAADNAVISSPRTTLESLLRLTDTFDELVREDGITRENRGRLKNIYQQVEKLFDLREIAPKFRRDVAVETAIYLREALARFPLPAPDAIPDEDQMAARIKAGNAALYRVPNTPVVIRRTEAGVYEGRYQFSSATVAEASDWFGAVRAYPYQEGQEHVAGIFENYFLTPGPLIPLKLIRGLPDWMQHEYLGQAVWQWVMLILTVIVLAGAILLLYVLVTRLARGAGRLGRNLLFLLRPLGVILLTQVARDFVDEQVFLTGVVLQNVLFVSKFIVLVATVALVMRLGSVLTETVLAARQLESRQIDKQLIRLGFRMLAVLVSVILVIEGMQQIGFSLATMVAGAGVTGLAIALAAQDTLKNIFGGLMLALDRPFDVGQRVMIKGYDGTIEEVGLRSTKVRTLIGHQISIPNEDAARMEVENIGRRRYIRRDLNVTITYDTPPEKIARAVEILQEILAVPETASDEAATPGDAERTPHPNEAVNQPGYLPRVYFSDLNADSLNLLVVYWFHPPDHWLCLEFAHRVNMQIMERFNAAGIDFAFPSQTLYLAGDSKRPLNPGDQPSTSRAATASVAAAGHAQTLTAKARKPGAASIEEELLHGETEDEAGESDDSTS
jgi:MscS family membrane protein